MPVIRALRSIAFYAAFYFGSIFIVLFVLVAMPFSDRVMRKGVRAWALYHRGCLSLCVGIRAEHDDWRLPGGALYAIRHESFFEAIDSAALFENPAVIAKRELFDIPLWGTAGLRYGLIPVDRQAGARALRAMLTLARARTAEGRPLVIFPEGTRVPHGQRLALQSGFVGMYKLLGLPVVPVAVDSGPLYHRWIKRPGTIHYKFGEPIPAGLPREEIEARVTEAINVLNLQGGEG